MNIEIWSDVMCPFCYIGFKRLENALEKTGVKDAEIVWKSYQLNPEFPEDSEGVSTFEYLQTRKGMSYEQVVASSAQLQKQGEALGIALNFDKAIIVNTRKAHRLLHFAGEHGKATLVKEALFKAHFTDGLNIAHNPTLLQIVADTGLDVREAEVILNADTYAYEVVQDIQEGVNLGLRGVPFFVFNRKYGIPGAHAPEVFENTIKTVLAEETPLQMQADSGAACDTETGSCN